MLLFCYLKNNIEAFRAGDYIFMRFCIIQKFSATFVEKFKMKTIHKIINGDSRQMSELKDCSVHLIITSPPYWQLKDYGTETQIGFNDSYESYINNLNLVWAEFLREKLKGRLVDMDNELNFRYKENFLSL